MDRKQPDTIPLEPGQLLTAEEVAHFLQISRSLVFRLVQRGDLPALRVGHLLRFRMQDVQQYIRNRALIPAKTSRRKRGPR